LAKVVSLTEEWVSKGQRPLWGYIRGKIPLMRKKENFKRAKPF